MKAIVTREPGDPSVLQYEDVPTPAVKPGWSLIQIKGFGINRSEIFTRNGWSPSVQFPRILGIEGVGVIAATTDATRLPMGQTVVTLMGEMVRAFDGSYAEYALIPNKQIYPVSTQLSWSELAAVPETFFTAYGSLLRLKLNAHDTLLIRGATSGVGVAAAKLARAMGVQHIIGSTRNLAKTAKLTAVGFTDVIEERDGRLQVDGPTATKILELVGPATMTDSLHALQPQGIICITGELGGVWSANFDPIASIPRDAYMTVFQSGNVTEQKFQTMLELITGNHIDVQPTKVFDLAHTADAQAFLDSSKSFGKVVVLP